MKAEKYVNLGVRLRIAVRGQCRQGLAPAFRHRLIDTVLLVPNWRNPLVNLVAEQIIGWRGGG